MLQSASGHCGKQRPCLCLHMVSLCGNPAKFISNLQYDAVISVIAYQKVASVSKDKVRQPDLFKIRNQFLKLSDTAYPHKAGGFAPYPESGMPAHRLSFQNIITGHIGPDHIQNYPAYSLHFLLPLPIQ